MDGTQTIHTVARKGESTSMKTYETKMVPREHLESVVCDGCGENITKKFIEISIEKGYVHIFRGEFSSGTSGPTKILHLCPKCGSSFYKMLTTLVVPEKLDFTEPDFLSASI
jgi:predicted RNA-binding Zn-ribbon protein involved in translation (DUF1610 family)